MNMLKTLVALVALAVSPSEPAAVRVTRLDGRMAEGRLVAWTTGEIVVETDGRDLHVDPAELLAMQRLAAEPAAAKEPIRVRLADGSELAVTKILRPFAAGRSLVVQSPLAVEPLELPAPQVASIAFVPRSDPSEPAWTELDRPDRGEDLLIVKKQDGAALDSIPGVVRGFNDETVDFDWDGESIAVKRSKVAAIGFHRRGEPSSDKLLCELALADGSRLKAEAVRLHGQSLTVSLVAAGVRFELPLAALAAADFSTGKIAYLSDLVPADVRWTPYVAAPPDAELLAAQGEPRRDESFGGAPVSLRFDDRPDATASGAVREFAKGLALRSRTQAAYRIPDGMTRFVAIAGIDPATVRDGRVTLVILGNDRVLWHGEIGGRDAPEEIDVALGDARRLELRVDYGENRDLGDRLHLAEARFTK